MRFFWNKYFGVTNRPLLKLAVSVAPAYSASLSVCSGRLGLHSSKRWIGTARLMKWAPLLSKGACGARTGRARATPTGGALNRVLARLAREMRGR